MKTATYLMGSFLLIFFLLSSGKLKEGYDIGDYAEDFSLPDVNGKMVSLSDFENAKGYLVIFTCNTCPYSVAYEDRINQLDKKYKPEGVPVIAINPNNPAVQPGDSMEKMKQRAAQKQFSFPYLLDKGQKVFPKYGATRTPHVFLLEKTTEGNLVRYIGTIDDNYSNPGAVETRYVEDAVDAMLSGKEITTKKTKAIGCSIKV